MRRRGHRAKCGNRDSVLTHPLAESVLRWEARQRGGERDNWRISCAPVKYTERVARRRKIWRKAIILSFRAMKPLCFLAGVVWVYEVNCIKRRVTRLYSACLSFNLAFNRAGGGRSETWRTDTQNEEYPWLKSHHEIMIYEEILMLRRMRYHNLTNSTRKIELPTLL